MNRIRFLKKSETEKQQFKDVETESLHTQL